MAYSAALQPREGALATALALVTRPVRFSGANELTHETSWFGAAYPRFCARNTSLGVVSNILRVEMVWSCRPQKQ
jgi:hypothetical protein